MTLTELAFLSLCVYGVVLLLTQGHIFGWWRWLVRNGIGRLTPDYPVDTCRMCQGVWFALALTIANGYTPVEALAVYGLSYFLATQERIS